MSFSIPEKNVDLHGSAPDKHEIALLLIDVINDFDFPGADQLLRYARPMARNLLRLKRRAYKAGVPVIYVNDNFGRWKSDFRRTLGHCARYGRGRDVVRLLRPEEDDYFVLKPKHSGFFSSALETLLRYLQTRTLIGNSAIRGHKQIKVAHVGVVCGEKNAKVPSNASEKTQRGRMTPRFG